MNRPRRFREAMVCWAVLQALSCLAQGPAGTSAEGASVLSPIVVTGNRDSAAADGVLGEPVPSLQAPVDLRTIGSAALREPGVQSLSSVLSRDASIAENYATSGYYQNFTVRGFTLDLGSAYRINGFVVPGEFDIPLENMASVQILEGLAGLHGGLIGAGGAINFVTRRPGEPNFARVDLDSRGGRLFTIDAGSRANGEGLALRLNATHADLRPDQPAARGRRDLLSLAADARPASDLQLQGDLIVQRRSQPAVPGFQLLGGTTLPDLSFSDVNINRQPWSRPVTNKGVMAGVRADWRLSEVLRFEGGVAQTIAWIDDNLATPSGCNSPPVQYFCSNGDYVLYDYHARERRSGGHLAGSFHGMVETGPWKHDWTAGLERIDRKIDQRDLYTATIYDDSGAALTGNLRTSADPLPAPVGIGMDQPRREATQRAGFVSDRLSRGRIDLLAALRWVEIVQQPEASRERRTLPQLALSWRFAPGQLVYVSAAESLEFGSEAPLTASNAGALLAPRSTRQVEIGWKGKVASDAQWALSVFAMRRPYEFTLPVGTSYAGLGDEVRSGTQTHIGISIGGETSPKNVLRLEGSIALLSAKAAGVSFADYNHVQLQNVPRLSSFFRTTYAPRQAPVQMHLDWTQRGARSARQDGSVSAPGYGVLDAGASWQTAIGARHLTLAMTVRNLTNHRYWRDTGEAYSADLLFPGASRSLALSAVAEF